MGASEYLILDRVAFFSKMTSKISELSHLTSSVRYAKGVGEAKARLLEKLGIRTILDLFWHFPTHYEDRSNLTPIGKTLPGKKQVIQGQVVVVSRLIPRKNFTIIKAAVKDGTGLIYAIWYNQDYLRQILRKGAEIVISGKVQWNFGEKQIQVEEFELLTGSEEDSINLKRIVPFYPLTQGLSHRMLRNIIKRNLEEKSSCFEDSLPDEIKKHYSLISLREALDNIHFPQNMAKQSRARTRLVFEEFFLLQAALAAKRKEHKKESGISFKIESRLVDRFLHSLPFTLTFSQKKVIEEVLEDMRKPEPMNRLLQGDVGSGKTIVATVALLTAIADGHQAALMAPTEILAQQHHLNLKQLLHPLGISPVLLVSDLPRKEREDALTRAKEGKIPLLIGTHALIQEEVEFDNLGMVVIDEQHRFGVMQRLKLRKKGISPDVLVMTATPIPRTLALTSHGDLDLSVIDELPPGRRSIITKWESEKRREEVYGFLDDKLKEGKQTYFVFPIIEESEELDLKAALSAYQHLQNEIFPDFRVELLHGRMRREEKEKIMHLFREGRIDILVSTTVIEVGIDVPNAVLMVIENAERFGLAQLHQLRGRVGRGAKQSYCFLLAGKRISSEAVQRMKVMCRTTDGFSIAEEDLKLRGPGDFFGTRQWGMLNLKIADLVRDGRILFLARKEAFSLIEKDPRLEKHPRLREALQVKFPHRLELAKVG